MPIAAIGAFIASAVATVTEVGTLIGATIGGAIGGTAAIEIGGTIGASIASAGLATVALDSLTTASDLLFGKSLGKDGGTQVNFMANPQAGVPYAMGRTGTAGNIVMVDSAGTNSAFLTYITVLSLGPISAYESFSANTIPQQFTKDNGEGANTETPEATVTSPILAGATVVPVGTVSGFQTGQSVTIQGGGFSETKTLASVQQSPKELTFSGGLAHTYPLYSQVIGPQIQSGYQNRMWLKTSLGVPNAPALTFSSTDSKDTPANHSGIPAVWTSSCQLSGLAATMWTLEYDAQVYSGGTPGPMNVIRGVLCYDPRQDDTYPGGSGFCVLSNESTWVYSENPYVHAITWLIGRTSNGVKTMGVHAPTASIDVAAFVAGANIADANGWTIGGVIYSTESKWDVLVGMLQAGSGTPLKLGAKISCMVNTPLVSLDTLTGDDVVGKAIIPTTTAARDRVNTIWPRYREEGQNWQIVPTQTPVIAASYVTVDGGQRIKETEYTLVQSSNQAAVLARYDIENAREIQVISLPCKPRWMGYKPGDCLTINEPEYGLNNQTVLVLSREVDPTTLITTLTFRTETAAKHAYALGQTANPPPTPSVTGFDPNDFAGPGAGAWIATTGTLTNGGTIVPVINVTGASDNPLAATVIVEYSPTGAGDYTTWSETPASTTTLVQITGLAPNEVYDVGVRYRSVKGVISDMTIITTNGIANGIGSYGAYVGSGSGDPGNLTSVGGLLYGADVITSQGTSNNTANVGAQSASQVISNIAAAYAAAQAAQATANTAISTIQADDGALSAQVLSAQNDATNALADIATANSNLTAEIANRQAGDSQNAASIASLTTTVNGNTSAISSEAITRASADSTLSAEITSLTATVTTNASTASANLTTEAGTRAAADSALSTSVTTLTSNYNSLNSTVTNNYTTLSNAQTTTAAAVTTLQGTVAANANPNPNLVTNPTWAQGLTGWSQPGTADFIADTANVLGPCLTYKNTGSSNTLSELVQQSTSYLCTAGAPYTLQIEALTSGITGGAITVGVQWNSSGSPVSTVTIPNSNGAWTQYSDVNVVAPSGATAFTAFIQCASSVFPKNASASFRHFKVEGGAVCTAYSDDQIGAALNSEAVIRASADTALSASITTLNSEVAGNTSSISTNYTTLSNQISSLSSTVTSLNSTVTSDNNTLTANLTSEANTRASADSTLTASVTTLTSNYNSLSSTVSNNYTTLSSAQSATAANVSTLSAQIYSNNNLLPGGNFENGFALWTVNAYGATCIQTGYVYDDPNYGQLGFLGAFTAGTIAYISQHIAVSAGQTYTLSGNIQIGGNGGGTAPTNPLCYLDRIYYDASGNEVSGGDGGQNAAAWGLAFAAAGPNYKYTETAPAGAVSCVVRWIGTADNFGSGVNCYAQRLKLETGSVATAYTAEAQVQFVSTAIVTLQSQTAYYMAEVTTSGGVAELELVSTSGGGTQAKIQADYIFLGANIAAASATATITFTYGGRMNVVGAGFGSGGQFVEWFGPTQSSLSACSEANAISYKRVDGAAYFAGTLSAGNITTTQLASGAASAIVETTWSAGFTLNSTANSGITSIGVTSTGGKHQITAQLTVAAQGSNNTGVAVTLSRDGTNIATRYVLFPNSFTSSHLIAFYDVPGAGSHTYVIAVAITSGSSTSSVLESIDLMSIEFRQAG